MVKRKQVLGIVGACLAVAGGITWFFHQYLISAILWAIAGVIILKLKKYRTRFKKR
jgi:uncharacterized membrane protein YeaQ/YmgE (transglycosylase-associated protein family)